jgi:hypothetical protein
MGEMEILSDFDPDEMVSAPAVSAGSISLRTAVKKIMQLPPDAQLAAAIFRERGNDPTLLSITHIRELARRPGFTT